jgi:hypothetical protein
MKKMSKLRNINEIKSLISKEEFILSRHAYMRTVERGIFIDEIIETSKNLEIIEEYPDDKYSPSCLLLGFTNKMRPLHTHISIDSSNILKIITIYEPDLNIWFEDFKTRRKS